jgi:hypothetical protein
MAIDGTYKTELDTPMGKQESTLTLKTEGGKLSGSSENQFGRLDFSGGTVNGDSFAFTLNISGPMGDMKLEYTGQVSGDDISGVVKAGDFGATPFTGKRV